MSEPREIRAEPVSTDRLRYEAGPAEQQAGVDELLAAVAEGDCQAFESLYGHLHLSVARLVLLLMRDAALAEEVTQEVFLTVWLQARRFDPGRGGGSAWVIGIARSRAIDRIRSVNAARQRDRSYAARADVPALPTPDLVSARLDGRMIREALAVLTPKQRQSLMLAFFDGLSYQEVSVLLGVPLPTVKARIRDGLTRLRGHLESTGQAWAALSFPARPAGTAPRVRNHHPYRPISVAPGP